MLVALTLAFPDHAAFWFALAAAILAGIATAGTRNLYAAVGCAMATVATLILWAG